MNLKIRPSFSLRGEINAPGSKSYSHRAFIGASLADGVSVIKNPLISGDVSVTISALKVLGVNLLKESESTYIVRKMGRSLTPYKETIDCKNSGTTVRIFCALSLLIEGGLSFKGEFFKKKRPLKPLLDALNELGGESHLTESELKIRRINKECNMINLRGDISSQFITALLMICPLLECKNTDIIQIDITTPITSYPYVKVTLDILEAFGINIQETIDNQKISYCIPCGQNYRNKLYKIPGDFSSIAFILAGAVLSPEDSEIVIKNLDFINPQGDKKIIDILLKMGAKIEVNKDKNQILVHGNINKYPLKGISIDCQDIPDLFPILSIIGAYAKGKTRLYNAQNLRFKESDRISVIARELKKLNVKVEEEKTEITVYQCKKIKGSLINHDNDHRIAMALTIAALYADSSSHINNIEIVNDSYPNFIRDLEKLGANIEKSVL
jgi:3-phosphoshikimate 1-carboxyvinyltransferase